MIIISPNKISKIFQSPTQCSHHGRCKKSISKTSSIFVEELIKNHPCAGSRRRHVDAHPIHLLGAQALGNRAGVDGEGTRDADLAQSGGG